MMSTFGKIFRVTTFGESHCKGVGAVIDGCPPGIALDESHIQPQLDRRKPARANVTTKRDETEQGSNSIREPETEKPLEHP